MRSFVEQNVSHRLCPELQAAGHDVAHVRAVSLHDGDDIEVFEFAARERRIIITSDTDFGGSVRGASVVVTLDRADLTRDVSTPEAVEPAKLLLANLHLWLMPWQPGRLSLFPPLESGSGSCRCPERSEGHLTSFGLHGDEPPARRSW